MSEKKISELAVATSLVTTDRLVVLVNPATIANTKTITLDNFVNAIAYAAPGRLNATLVTNTSFTANSSHEVFICQPAANTILTLPTSAVDGKTYTVKYANGSGTLTVQSNTAGKLENPTTGVLSNTFVMTTGTKYTWISSNGFYWSI